VEAQRTLRDEGWESFVVIRGGIGSYQVTYRYRENAWHIQNRHGRSINPHGRVGREVVEACRELRRAGD
jgi:hypothetical protein